MSKDEVREKFVSEVLASLDDGFQISDLAKFLVKAMEYYGTVADLSGTEKKEEVLKIVALILDKTDSPGPDFVVDNLIKYFLPDIIDRLCDAAKGKLDFGGST